MVFLHGNTPDWAFIHAGSTSCTFCIIRYPYHTLLLFSTIEISSLLSDLVHPAKSTDMHVHKNTKVRLARDPAKVSGIKRHTHKGIIAAAAVTETIFTNTLLKNDLTGKFICLFIMNRRTNMQITDITIQAASEMLELADKLKRFIYC